MQNLRRVFLPGQTIPLFPATIAEVEFGVGVTKIPNSFMESNTSLTSIVIPEGVTEIGLYAFRMASALVEVSLPSTLESFGNATDNAQTFMGTKIKNLIIPDKVTELPIYLIDMCDNLESITIGKGVTSIGQLIYKGDANDKLAEIIISCETPPAIAADCFTFNTTLSVQIKVPAAAVDAYKAAEELVCVCKLHCSEHGSGGDLCGNARSVAAPSSKDEL